MTTSHPPEAFGPVIQALARLDRRAFLRSAAALSASGALGLSGLNAQANPVAGLKFQTDAEAAIFLRVAQVVLPVAGTRLTPWTPEGLLQTLDGALLATMAPHILAGLKGGLQYFNDGPLVRWQQRFTALSDAQAAAFLDDWGDSALPPQRGLAMGLKKLVQLSYWANPASWAPLGYDGPLTRRLGIASLGNAPMPTR